MEYLKKEKERNCCNNARFHSFIHSSAFFLLYFHTTLHYRAPDEWGYCQKTNQPKPPRSHYDYVSKSLVMCMDHYCPWMFNASK